MLMQRSSKELIDICIFSLGNSLSNIFGTFSFLGVGESHFLIWSMWNGVGEQVPILLENLKSHLFVFLSGKNKLMNSPTLVWLHWARTCVCLLACLDRPSAFIYFTKINIVKHVGLTVKCSVCDPERRRLKLNHAWQCNSDLCLYRRWQVAHRKYKDMDHSDCRGRGLYINARNLAHDSGIYKA